MALASPVHRFSLVPVLALAGFVSGIYSDIVIRAMSYDTANPYPYTLFGSLCFGLTLCAVLWAFGFVRSQRAAVLLVVATLAIHLVDAFVVERRLVNRLIVDVTLPVVGKVLLVSLVEHLLVALGLFGTFLLVLVPGWRKLWSVVVAPIFSVLTVAVIFNFVRTAESLVVNDTILGFTAQTVQAGLLAVALALAGGEVRTPLKRFTLVYVQLGYFVVVFVGTYLFVDLPMQAAAARAQREIAARLASAPPRVNLPALNEESIDRVLLTADIGAWRSGYSNSSRLPAEETGGDTFAPRPERISYYTTYGSTTAKPDDLTTITVQVTQYPNAEWAKFDVLNSTRRTGIPRLTRFGHTFYQDGPYYSWSSGDRLIVLDCPPLAVVDEFLKAYLAKYPSSL